MGLRKVFPALFYFLFISFAGLFVVCPLMADEPLEGAKEETLSTDIALTLIELYTMSNALPKALIDLQNEIESTTSVEKLLLGLPDIENRIEKLEWETTMASSDPTPSYHQLASLDSRLTKIKYRLDLINHPVESNMHSLELWYRQWAKKEHHLAQLLEGIKDREVQADSADIVLELEAIIGEGKKLILDRIRPTLAVGREIGRIQTRVYELNDKVTDLVQDANVLDIQQTSPSMLTRDYYRQLDRDLIVRSWDNIRLFGNYQLQYIKQNSYGVAAGLFFLVLLLGIIVFTKSQDIASSRWAAFASRPFSTALFLGSATVLVINQLPIPFNLPPGWDSLLTMPMILAVAMLTDTVCKTPWQSRLLRRSAVFLAGMNMLIILDLSHTLLYLLVFYSSAATLLFYLFLFYRRLRTAKAGKLTWAVVLWGIVPLLIIACGVTGHDTLAILILGMVLAIVVMSLMIWLMLYMLAGVVELLLLNFPLHIVRQNASMITGQLFPAMFLGHILLWLAIVLVILRVFPTVEDAFAAISSAEISVFSLSITPVSLLAVSIILYLTILFSKGIRAFLEQDILERYGVEKGVQVSITRLVHYAVLTIGFFILLKMLGFRLHQLAILGGALGVGIGFGLQAIVNNFVSGLILLFERPVKVGDIIETTEGTGRIKELGLRATIVATFDDAEIVIPNSELVTGSVTNWTLASKHVRVKVPVGVSYGSEIEQVKNILLSCAEANPLVLTNPQPKAFFLSFGASSLDFELRVWIPDVQERRSVLSELNQDIEAEFALAGIEIPFPQSDVHFRSVDKEVLSLLQDKEKRELEG